MSERKKRIYRVHLIFKPVADTFYHRHRSGKGPRQTYSIVGSRQIFKVDIEHGCRSISHATQVLYWIMFGFLEFLRDFPT